MGNEWIYDDGQSESCIQMYDNINQHTCSLNFAMYDMYDMYEVLPYVKRMETVYNDQAYRSLKIAFSVVHNKVINLVCLNLM